MRVDAFKKLEETMHVHSYIYKDNLSQGSTFDSASVAYMPVFTVIFPLSAHRLLHSGVLSFSQQ